MFLIETFQHDNFSELIVFSRDKEGKKVIKRVTDFRPYFFVPEDEKIVEYNTITGIETGYKSILGKPLKKIYVKRSLDVTKLRDTFEETYEADIMFTQRYIIDKIGIADVYPLKILSLDIETDSKDTFPDIERADQAITCISFCDNKFKEQSLLYKHPNCKVPDKDLEKYAKVYHTEEDFLMGILAYIKAEDPDVLTGYNVMDFDILYLMNRMKRLGIDYRKLSPLGSVHKDEYYQEIHIKGRIILDMYNGYKQFRSMSNQGRMESYSLEYVAQTILKKGKIPHEDAFHKMWVENPIDLLKYNQRDARLVIELDNKLGIIEFFNYLRAISCAQMSQIYRTTALVDGYLLRKAHNKYVLPSKPKDRTKKKYSGAFVFSPTPDVYTNILVLDVKGLYPNIIRTFNIGYETLDPKGQIKIREGLAFNKGKGIISESMEELAVERRYYKKMVKEDKANYYKQYAVKVLMNSFYGYLGYPGSRLYKHDIAGAITYLGQEILKYTEKQLNKNGYKIVAGDTDSVFFQGKGIGILSLIKEGNTLAKEITNSYIDFVKSYGANNSTLEIEFEKIFKKVMFVGKKGSETEGAKKKYAYIPLWKDGELTGTKIEFVGFSSRRSDTPRIARSAERKVMDMILNNVNREEIVDYLKDLDKKIRSNEVSVEEIAFPKGISKSLKEYGKVVIDDKTGKKRKTGTPPVVQGARFSNKYLGTRFRKGSKPKWIYIKSVPRGYPNTNIISFTETIPNGFIPDYDKIIERLFKMKLESVFKAAKLGEFPVIDSTKKPLSEFF